MTLSAGTRLGSYEILAPLGAGGMGEVYRARDSKLDREVAIKVLPEMVAKDPDALARFEREAKAVAALSHPNILAIHDFGSEAGAAYAVTELLEGETLRGKIDAGPVSHKLAVDWALQMARGLSAAHGKGVIHRDLKPENVFVTKDGHVKILDFGLAKRVEAVSPEEQTGAPTGSGRTEPGTVMGTVGYMSPEQLMGQPVDHRTDIFSLGAVLYELLSGQKAFRRTTGAETIAAVLKEDPPELTHSGRNVSPALDRIVRHCLEKDRDSRFQTVRDVAFNLSEVSGSTAAATTGVHWTPPGRRRVLVVAVLALLAAAGVLVLRRPHRASAAPAGVKRVAVLPFENLGAPEDDYFADGIADAVRGKLTSISGLQVIARGSSTPYKKTTKTPKEIAQELEATYLLTATVRWEKSGGTSRVLVTPELVEVTASGPPSSKWQQPFHAALTDVFQVQSEIASKVAQALGLVLASNEERSLSERPTENMAAYDAFLKGEEASGGMAATDPAALHRALAFYEQAIALDPSFVQAWARVSMCNTSLFYLGTPVPELSRQALSAAEKAVALAPGRAEGYVALGNYQQFVVVDFGRALEQYEKGRRLAPANAELLTWLALAEESLGRWDAALGHFKESERLDPRSAITIRRLAEALLYLRRYLEARETLDRGLAVTPGNLDLLEDKAVTYLGEGDLAGARAVAASRDVEPTALVAFFATYWDLGWVLDEAQRKLLLRLTPSAFDEDRTNWGLCLAQASALKGDEAGTRMYAGEAQKSAEQQVREPSDDPQRYTLLGLSLAYLGRKEEAIREGQRGVAMLPVAKDARQGPYFQHQLVRIYILVDEPDKALDQLEPLLKIPYYLSPGWLKIDPNFDPLRKNPRFQKLVAGAK